MRGGGWAAHHFNAFNVFDQQRQVRPIHPTKRGQVGAAPIDQDLHAARELASARDYYDVQQRLVKQMRAEAAAERISEQTLIREEMNALVAEAKRDIAFAAVQNAYANIFASVGLDPYGSDLNYGGGVGELEAQLRGLWLERGDFGSHGRITLAAR